VHLLLDPLPAPDDRSPLTVIGVGNDERGDDAAGLLVARAVPRGKIAPADLTRLVELWAADDHVVVVDAVVSGAAPGTIHLVEALGASPGAWGGAWSSHGIDLDAALRLAVVLGKRPLRLSVVGIEAAGFEVGTPPAPTVVRAARQVAARLTSGFER
jgi:hydrogenase maturation protease